MSSFYPTVLWVSLHKIQRKISDKNPNITDRIRILPDIDLHFGFKMLENIVLMKNYN